MLAGRPHEAAGNGSPRWMTVASHNARAQNPAYRPTHPLFTSLTCGGALVRWRPGHFRGTCARSKRRTGESVSQIVKGRVR